MSFDAPKPLENASSRTTSASWYDHPGIQNANLTISDHQRSLAFPLRSDPRFQIAHEDKPAVLFKAGHPEKGDNPKLSQTR